MAEKKIGARIVLEGEAEYRSAIKQINAEQKELRSEMKLVASEFEGQENSIEAITAKNEVLAKQYETQNRKLEEYNKMLEASQEAQSSQAEEVERLNKALEDASEEYNRLIESGTASNEEIEAQRDVMQGLEQELDNANARYQALQNTTSQWQTSVNLAQADLNNLKNEMSRTTEETSRFGDVLAANLTSEALTAGLTKLLDLMKEAGEELINMGTSAAFYADSINTLSTQTGIATDTIQTFKYAEELMDVSLSTATNAMRKNIQSMDKARSGTESYLSAYEKLGVSVEDANGNLRDSEEVFWECVDALGKMTNNAEKDATAMTLFGRSAQQLNPLIKTGSEGFRKYGEEAKKLGYILDTETLNGLNATSDAIERGSKMIDSVKMKIGAELAPEIESAVSVLSKAISDNDEELQKLCEGSIKALTGALEFIINNADTILTFMGGMAGAFVAWEAAQVTITAVSTAMGIYEAVTQGATIAQLALNAAMDANPIGLVAGALGALIGALTTYAAVSGTASKNTTGLQKDVTDLQKKIGENRDVYADQTKAMQTNAQTAQDLTAKIKTLNGATDPQKQIELKNAVAQLNSIYPELALSINESTGEINGNTDALESNLEAIERRIQLEANEERALEVAKESVDAKNKLKEAEEGLTKAKEEQIELEAKRQEQLLNEGMVSADLQLQIDQNTESINKYNSSVEALNGEISNLEDEYNGLIVTQEELKKTTDDANDSVSKYFETMVETANGSISVKVSTQEQAEAVQNLAEAYNTAQTSARESLDSQIGLFEKLTDKSDMSVKDIEGNLQSQITVMNSMNENLNTLQERFSNLDLSTDLLTQLASLGTDGAGYIKELANASDEDLQKVVDSFAEVNTAKDELSASLATWSEEVQNAIINIGEGADGEKVAEQIVGQIVTGFKGNTEKVTSEAKTIVDDSKKTMIDATKTFDEVGEAQDSKTADGIKANEGKVTKATEEVAKKTLETAKTEFSSDEFKKVGENLVDKIAEGVKSNNAIAEAIKSAVKNAIKEAKNASNDDEKKKDGEDSEGGEQSGGEASGEQQASQSAFMMASLPVYSEYAQSINNASTSTSDSSLAKAIADSISDNVEIKATFEVSGDSASIFKVVRKEANTYAKATGRSAFNE